MDWMPCSNRHYWNGQLGQLRCLQWMACSVDSPTCNWWRNCRTKYWLVRSVKATACSMQLYVCVLSTAYPPSCTINPPSWGLSWTAFLTPSQMFRWMQCWLLERTDLMYPCSIEILAWPTPSTESRSREGDELRARWPNDDFKSSSICVKINLIICTRPSTCIWIAFASI